MEPIPMAIVHEILVKLPMKSWKRFQCVSKTWRSFISHPSFHRDYKHRRSQQDPLLLVSRYKPDEASNTSTLLLSTYKIVDGTMANNISVTVSGCYSRRTQGRHRIWYNALIQCCHGLICRADSGYDKIFLCYPPTGEQLTLPPLQEDNTWVDCVGFGYAVSTNVFKVVRFFHYWGYDEYDEYDEYNKSCEVFTVGTSEWREVAWPSQYQRNLWWGAAYLNGAIFFLMNKKVDLGDEPIDGMFAFDVESEEFRSFPVPLSYRRASAIHHRGRVRANSSLPLRSMYLKKLRGSLCITFDFDTTLELWLLKDYISGEWLKEYTIDLTSLSCSAWGEPIEIMHDSLIMLCICDRNGEESLYTYNPHDRTFTQELKEDNGVGLYAVASYVEKFSSLPFQRKRKEKKRKEKKNEADLAPSMNKRLRDSR